MTVGQSARDDGLALIEEEQRAITHIDDEVAFQLDVTSIDVHAQLCVDNRLSEFVVGQIHGRGILDKAWQGGSADDT